MANTQHAKKTAEADQNGQPDEKAAQQAAQQAEAAEAPIEVKFDGHVYEVLPGQPSPKAFTYLAQFSIDGHGLAIIPALIETIGREQWDLWCERHRSQQMVEFWQAIEDQTSGNS